MYMTSVFHTLLPCGNQCQVNVRKVQSFIKCQCEIKGNTLILIPIKDISIVILDTPS